MNKAELYNHIGPIAEAIQTAGSIDWVELYGMYYDRLKQAEFRVILSKLEDTRFINQTEDGEFEWVEGKSCSDILASIKHQSMGELEMQFWLAVAIELACEENGEAPAEVDLFSDAGLLTRNSGLVVRMEDGAEFHLTIVKSN